MREIDLIIEESGVLHPIEIKKTASPDKSAVNVFSVLKSAGRQVGNTAFFAKKLQSHWQNSKKVIK